MVDGQIRPNRVTDPRVIAGMRSLRRELFVPPALAALAYSDEDIALPGGRALMEPMVLARLIQEAAAPAGGRALVVAGGTGYAAALLARCGLTATLLEDDAALLAIARAALAAEEPGVIIAEGPVVQGWPASAPYDLILIEGAVPAIPPAIVEQLAPAGRIATVLDTGMPGTAVLATAHAGRAVTRVLFDCAVRPIPAFRHTPSFVF